MSLQVPSQIGRSVDCCNITSSAHVYYTRPPMKTKPCMFFFFWMPDLKESGGLKAIWWHTNSSTHPTFIANLLSLSKEGCTILYISTLQNSCQSTSNSLLPHYSSALVFKTRIHTLAHLRTTTLYRWAGGFLTDGCHMTCHDILWFHILPSCDIHSPTAKRNSQLHKLELEYVHRQLNGKNILPLTY